MKTSVVVVSRNDDYGKNLKYRAIICLNSMLDTFDEVIYVDWNSPEDKTLIEEIRDELPNTERLRVIQVTQEQHKKFTNNAEHVQPCVEVLARNVGIRRATGDIIVSSNIDIVPPSKERLHLFLNHVYDKDFFYTFARRNIELQDLQKANRESVAELKKALYKKAYLIEPKQLLSFASPSKIRCCGDFQLASKEIWYKIRGFEETLTKRFWADSHAQLKAIMAGYPVAPLFDIPVFHISHEYTEDTNKKEKANSAENLPRRTENDENWGYSDIEFKGEII